MKLARLPVTPETVGPIGRGHPWVYQDGVGALPPAGTPVVLTDTRGKTLAWGLADDGDIAVRILGRHFEPLAELVQARVQRAIAWRKRCIPTNTDAFRLVNGAGDGLPGVVVDVYAGVAVLRIYSHAWLPNLPLLVDALAPFAAVVRKLGVTRVDGQQGCEVLKGSPPDEPWVVTEAGLKFLVRPSTGQKTGLFLDQRENRIRLAPLCAGQSMTNLFAYNGGFSVHAAAAGATHVTSVDVAEEALDDAKENFRQNGLNPDKHRFEATDAFAWDEKDQVIVCDPPSLTHGKKADKNAEKAYRELSTRVGRLVAPDGVLATASCSARIARSRWERAVRDGLRTAGRYSVLWTAYEPPDHPVLLAHPEGQYLKFAVLRRSG